MADLDLLLEAERRGILSADKSELLAEARNRGLVPTIESPQVSLPQPPLEPPAGSFQQSKPYTWRSALLGHGEPVRGAGFSESMTELRERIPEGWPRTLFQFVFPQTEAEMGMAIGTGGAGKLASSLGLRRFPAALMRIAGGATGGATGAMISGEEVGPSAVKGGLGAAIPEVLAPALSRVARALPGVKGWLASREAAKIGERIGEAAPPLAGKRSAAELQTMALQPWEGLYRLGDFFENSLKSAESIVGNRPLNVPALSANPVSLREASELLKEVGYKGFSGAKGYPLERTFLGKGQRDLYQTALSQIEDELNRLDKSGESWKAFEAGRQVYSRGRALLDLLQAPGTFRGGPNEIQLNMRAVQDYLSRERGFLAQRLGPYFDELVKTSLRGGPLGSLDIPAPGRGHAGEAAAQVFARGQGGAPQYIGVPLRTALPNIGGSYTGKPPLSVSPELQVILNILGQRGLSQINPTVGP